jgi:hypothetical protein
MADSVFIPSGYKRCGSGEACVHPDGPVLPATKEYFYAASQGRGLQSMCKHCSRARGRAYRQSHSVKVKAKRWVKYITNREAELAKQRRYREEHRELCRERSRSWYQRHIVAARAKAREYNRAHRDEINRQRREERRVNPEKAAAINQQKREWYRANPEKVAEYNRRNRLKYHERKRKQRSEAGD